MGHLTGDLNITGLGTSLVDQVTQVLTDLNNNYPGQACTARGGEPINGILDQVSIADLQPYQLTDRLRAKEYPLHLRLRICSKGKSAAGSARAA